MSAGDLLAQGGQNIVNNLDQYRQIQNLDAQAQGSIDSFINQGPQAMSSLSPDAQNLLQKQLSGKASAKDRLQILGEITATQGRNAAMAEMQFKRAEAAQKYAAAQKDIASVPGSPEWKAGQQAQLDMINQMQGGQGGGQPSPQVAQNLVTLTPQNQAPDIPTPPVQQAAPPPPPFKSLADQPQVNSTHPQAVDVYNKSMRQYLVPGSTGIDFATASQKAAQAQKDFIDSQNGIAQPIGVLDLGVKPEADGSIYRQLQPVSAKRGGQYVLGDIQKVSADSPVSAQKLTLRDGKYVPVAVAAAQDNAAQPAWKPIPGMSEYQTDPATGAPLKAQDGTPLALDGKTPWSKVIKAPQEDVANARLNRDEHQKLISAADDTYSKLVQQKDMWNRAQAGVERYAKMKPMATDPENLAWFWGTDFGRNVAQTLGYTSPQEMSNLSAQQLLPLIQGFKGTGQVRSAELEAAGQQMTQGHFSPSVANTIVKVMQARTQHDIDHTGVQRQALALGNLPSKAVDMANQLVPPVDTAPIQRQLVSKADKVNISKSGYDALKSGDTYWWNGAQHTKK